MTVVHPNRRFAGSKNVRKQQLVVDHIVSSIAGTVSANIQAVLSALKALLGIVLLTVEGVVVRFQDVTKEPETNFTAQHMEAANDVQPVIAQNQLLVALHSVQRTVADDVVLLKDVTNQRNPPPVFA